LFVEHYTFDTPFSSYINGQNGVGFITKPLKNKETTMDEEESTGI